MRRELSSRIFRGEWEVVIIILAIVAAGFAGTIVQACSPAQTRSAVDAFNELAGEVCVAGDEWKACAKKCADEERRREAAK